MMKKTVTISGTELDLVTWAVRGLVALIMFFLGQLYFQVQSMDEKIDALKSDAKVMRQAMRDHGFQVERAEKSVEKK